MLYLTAYQSAHLRKKSCTPLISSYETFYNPEKARTIWYLENDLAIKNAKEKGMTPLIVTRQEVSNLEEALEIIRPQSPIAFKYWNDAFNDDEAKQLALFIRFSTTLVYLEYYYSCNGAYAYRELNNRLTDAGYDAITQAIEVNPLIQKCFISNHGISNEITKQRDLLLARNQILFSEKNIYMKINAYRRLYQDLRKKYDSEMLENTAIVRLLDFPSLQLLTQSVIRYQEFPTEVLPAQLLAIIEPPTIEMGCAIEKLSELNTSIAKEAELHFYWKNFPNVSHAEPIEDYRYQVPFVYFPPKIS